MKIIRRKEREAMEGIMLIHPEKCTGCRICELVCSFNKKEVFSPHRSRVRVFKAEEEGIDLPMMCMHCEDPVCSDVCPVGAVWKEEDGAVKQDASLCRGCHACMVVCPFGAVSIEEGTVVKCDLCGGDPQCVKWCVTGALEFVREDKAKMRLIERKAEAIIKSLQGQRK